MLPPYREYFDGGGGTGSRGLSVDITFPQNRGLIINFYYFSISHGEALSCHPSDGTPIAFKTPFLLIIRVVALIFELTKFNFVCFTTFYQF